MRMRATTATATATATRGILMLRSRCNNSVSSVTAAYSAGSRSVCSLSALRVAATAGTGEGRCASPQPIHNHTKIPTTRRFTSMSQMTRRPLSSSTSSGEGGGVTVPAVAGSQSLPANHKTSSDGVVGLPIDFDVQSKVEGKESQIVTIELQPNQVLRAESGAMVRTVYIYCM
jgi:hypothetical protein